MRAALWDAPIAEGEAILGGMRAARRETDLSAGRVVSLGSGRRAVHAVSSVRASWTVELRVCVRGNNVRLAEECNILIFSSTHVRILLIILAQQYSNVVSTLRDASQKLRLDCRSVKQVVLGT